MALRFPALSRTARSLAGALLLGGTALAEEGAPGDDPYSGTYDVVGVTVDQKTGDTRRIEGHVVLTKKGDGWQAASELATEYPTLGGSVRADVIGTGDGKLRGAGLVGTARTQLVIQTVPGVDTDFAFIPRQVGPRIVSDWQARREADGTLVVELTNRGEEGEEYSPTKTTLRGKRVKMPGDAAKGAKP